MAGLTKEQRAAKEAALAKETIEPSSVLSQPGEQNGLTAILLVLQSIYALLLSVFGRERLASNLQLHAGLDALGASLTVSISKNASKIVMEANGAYVTGKKTDGKIFIPYANIRGAVLI